VEKISLARLADVRYLGQGFELQVPVPGGMLDPQQVSETLGRFHEAHSALYGYSNPENPVEVVNLRVTSLASTPRPSMEPAKLDGAGSHVTALDSKRDVFFGGEYVYTPVYDRTKLAPGGVIDGPAIVEQLDSTTVVWPGQTARVDGFRNLVIERVSQ